MTPVDGNAPGPTPGAPAKTNPSGDDLTSEARALLDSEPDVLCRLWEKVDDLWRHRRVDAGLRADILRVAAKVSPELVERLEQELDVATPAAVLEAYEHELIEDRPTIGAFPRPEMVLEVPGPGEWTASDPRRLRAIVFEVALFCKDDQRVAESVLGLAQMLGINLELAAGIVGHALLDVHHSQAAVR